MHTYKYLVNLSYLQRIAFNLSMKDAERPSLGRDKGSLCTVYQCIKPKGEFCINLNSILIEEMVSVVMEDHRFYMELKRVT